MKKKSEYKITTENIKGHIMTVMHHKKLVMQGCFAVGLYQQGIMHDLSKFAPIEFINGCKYYQGGKRSPNNAEREEKGYSEAWMHHKGRNRHHLEYWNDYISITGPDEFPVGPVPMPRKYVAEMLMDRIAASKTYLKDKYTQHEPLKYYKNGKGQRLIHKQSARELERLLTVLDRKGEKALYRYVKEYYLKGYPI